MLVKSADRTAEMLAALVQCDQVRYAFPYPGAAMRACFVLIASCLVAAQPAAAQAPDGARMPLPTGQWLDPAGTAVGVGQMPLAMVPAPGDRQLVLLLNGYREQGIQVVDRDGQVLQTVPQEAAFIGLAFAADGRTLFASGGNQEVVYRYDWTDHGATLRDSLILAPKVGRRPGTHYPAALAPSADGRWLYVAENLADSLAVVDLRTDSVIQRVATGRYPYGVVLTPDGTVFVSNWGANALSVFTVGPNGRLTGSEPVAAGRHPSAMLLNATGTRLFVASGSTDRIAVLDTKARKVIAELRDPPPAGPDEGTTPNALALSADGTRLFVAEADANAVAVFDLTAETAAVATARGDDRLAGRIPVGWYPTSLAVLGDTLYVGNGKGLAAGPNPQGPGPYPRTRGRGRHNDPLQYTLGQIRGALSIVPGAGVSGAVLAALSARAARANGWNGERPQFRYPPLKHVIYILKENRTYDQVLGDLPQGDGDTALVLFGRDVTPNQHALAERFGVFDRFFVNSEVSADGHNWSMAAYATDYVQKTTPTNYSGDGRTYDYEGLNRGEHPEEDVASPAGGYLWDLAQRAEITFRNFGEFVEAEGEGDERRYRGTKPFLAAHTDSLFPVFDMRIPDQRRADIWLAQFRRWEREGEMPAFQIMHLPRDHTACAAANYETPSAMVADNDLALGRMVEAVSRSQFWSETAIFVMEDDAQNGPDHIDSHRSLLLVISPWTRGGVLHRFTNTTDVLRTIEEVLGLAQLSQFDWFGRPIREIWSDQADTRPYAALTPVQPLDEMNPPSGVGAALSQRFDFSRPDAAEDIAFGQIVWYAVKGPDVPWPGLTRMSSLEARRSR
jgi:YVTN family beta-propeller protein